MRIETICRRAVANAARRRDRCPPAVPAVLVAIGSVALGFVALGAPLPALAQAAKRPAVEVDLGALDALPPAAPDQVPSRIRLHLPAPKPTAAAPPPSSAPVPGQKAAASKAAPSAPAENVASAPPPSVPNASQKTAAPKAPSENVAAVPPSAPPRSKVPPPPVLPPPAVGADAKPTPPPPQSPPPNASASVGPVEHSIVFTANAVALPDSAKPDLDALAKRLSEDAKLYVQLVAYAAGASDASEARRLSLTRALAARSYLVDHGVEIKQVDVRPLGNRSEPGLPPDRVDLVVVER